MLHHKQLRHAMSFFVAYAKQAGKSFRIGSLNDMHTHATHTHTHAHTCTHTHTHTNTHTNTHKHTHTRMHTHTYTHNTTHTHTHTHTHTQHNTHTHTTCTGAHRRAARPHLKSLQALPSLILQHIGDTHFRVHRHAPASS